MTQSPFASSVLRLIQLGTITLIMAVPTAVIAKGSEPLDGPSEQALRQTQQLMTDQTARAKMLQTDSKANATDQAARANLGEHTEGAYQISAQVLEAIVRETGGDPAKMQAISNELLANPNALEKYLSSAQRDQIRSMASEIEKKNGAAPVSGAK